MKKRSPNNGLHPNIWVLSITSFLTDVSSEMLFNLLPLFLFNVLGVRTVTIGLIDGIAETTSSLVKIFSGMVSDHLKNRKALAVLGYSLSTLAKPFLYFSSTWSSVLGIRFADRVGKGVRTAPRDALLANSVKQKNRGLAFGIHRAGDTAGAFTGLAIATFIIWNTQVDLSNLTRSAFQLVVIASIVPAVLAVIVLALGAREIDSGSGVDSSKPISPFRWKKLGKRFKYFLFVIVIFTLGNSSDAFIILRGQERGLNIIQVLLMLLTFNAVYSIFSSPAGLLSDRIGRRRVIIFGFLIYSIIYLGFALARTGLHIWLMFGFYGIYYAFIEGNIKAYVADLVSPDYRGTAYGFLHASIGLATLPASLIAGILWQGIAGWTGFGAQAPFIFGSSTSLIACFLFYIKSK